MSCPQRVRGSWLLSTLAVASSATLAGAATFTVINTNASGAGSLEQAITSANASPDTDTIEFAIPGGGVPTIVDSLPAITQPVVIDGTTQSGGFVELQNGGGTALNITGSGSTVRGMVLNSSATGIGLGPAAGGNTITGCRIGTDPTGTMVLANQAGVFVQGPSGGGNTISNNLVSGNSPNGINIQGNNTVVTGNVIGLDVTQTQPLGGGTGVLINNGSNNRVGGTAAGEGNVIAGLPGNGVSVTNATAQGNVIQGNRIGTNAANAAGLGNGTGVSVAAVTGAGNVVGGAAAGAGNLIVASASNGVAVLNSANLTIQGNTIGTAALPNVANGIDMAGADSNLLQGNVIAGNGQAGINVRSGADGNTIRGNEISGNGGAGIGVSGGQMDRFTENAIHDNGGLGIDLGVIGVAVNDPLDVDVASGHNDGQNYPVLSTASASAVPWTLNSLATTSFTVEFFASPACDASGNGEGGTFLGATQVMTDAMGDAADTFPLPPEAAGQVITATATAPDGDTSEFSACTGPVPGSTTTTSLQPTTTSTSTTSTTTTSTSTTAPTTSTVSSTTSSSAPTTFTTVTTSTTAPVSTSTTSTSSSVTSSSTSSTTTASSSTTSTTLGDGCASEPLGPTFRSLNCRLAAVLAQVTAASDLGALQPRLQRLLEKAKERKEQAESACLEVDPRSTKKRLKQAIRKLIEVERTLRTRRARKTIPDALREALLAVADGLRLDLRTLRGAVRCPDDAA